MGKIFNQSLVPSETVYDGRLLDPREMRPDPVLNGRVELPEIDKFYADFLNPKIGQLQPITIKKVDGLPIIVDGVTRWRAALKITEEGQGYKDGVFMLKCQYFVAKSPVDYFVATIKANIRNEPKIEDDAHNVSVLIHNFNMSEDEIARDIYRRTLPDGTPDVQWVKDCAALNDLTPEGIEALKSGKVKGIKAAVALSKLTAKVQREQIKRLEGGEKLTVAALKRAAAPAPQSDATEPAPKAPAKRTAPKTANCDACETIDRWIGLELPPNILKMGVQDAVRNVLRQLADEIHCGE